MKFPKVRQQQKKSMLAVEALLSVLARYQVGDKLPPERVLAHEMDISRNTLREAIAALQVMGIIEVRHSQGNFIVSLPNPAALQSSLATILHPKSEPFSIVDARVAFEPGVAYLAAERATTEEIQQLEHFLNSLIVCTENDDLQGYAEADYQFHLHIAKASHNELIIDTMTSLVAALKTPLWQAMKKGLDQNVFRGIRAREHQAIFEHIAKRNALEAAASMRNHLTFSRERFLHERE